MVNKKLVSIIVPAILLNMIFIGGVGYGAAIPKMSGTTPMTGIVMDGVIEEDEWSDADWKVGFYLDIDDVGNPPDTDGMNYMYLGEDEHNLYLGLDLCSDKTVGTTDEWIGAWLITNNRSFTDVETWVSYLDDGTESLLHDVENDVPYPYFLNVSLGGSGVFPKSDNQYTAIWGSVEGDYSLLNQSGGQPTFNLTSAPYLAGHRVQVDFSIDIKDYYDYFKELYANATVKVRVTTYGKVDTNISDNEITFWYSNGTMNENDPLQTYSINNGTSLSFDTGTMLAGNLTSDNKMQFSIIAGHSSPFKIQLVSMSFGIFHLDRNTKLGALSDPYSSISNYQIEWGFGPSPNNATDHRMYEIKIPKSELEHYDSNADLGIIIGGYGTMSFANKNYWAFSQFNYSIREEISDNYWYYNMAGLIIPDTINPAIISTPSDLTVDFGYTGQSLSWTATDLHPSNYTIEQQGSGIVVGPTTWTSGVPIIFNIPDGFAVGNYTYTINFTDESGNSFSDTVNFIVNIGTGTAGGSIPFGNYFLIFIGFGVICLIFIKKRQIIQESRKINNNTF
ncbi:hypothetical protein LCGC14_1058210 [marine sediment metagenome]|uniref:Uncharacterized protein n=1 Tax=marine sediment metagenome TaxID=412755 RepID=A0A0F9MRJ4_9ZZZZ